MVTPDIRPFIASGISLVAIQENGRVYYTSSYRVALEFVNKWNAHLSVSYYGHMSSYFIYL